MKEEDTIGVLRICAWLNLISGIVGAIYVWASIAEKTKYTRAEVNPSDIVLGFALLAAGVFGFFLLLAVCLIAENLIEIRKALPKEKDFADRLFSKGKPE